MRSLMLMLLLFIISIPSSAAVSFVQKNIGDNSGTANTSLSVSFPAPTTPGDLIVVYVVPAMSQPGTVAVSDSEGNAYYGATSTLTTGQCSMAQEFFYSPGIVGGADTITATTTSAGGMIVVIMEYSGVATNNPLDAQAGSAQLNCQWTSIPSSAAITTTNPNDLIVTGAALASTWNAGTGYTLRVGKSLGVATADQTVSASGTYGAVFNLAQPTSWIAAAVAFRAVGPGILCGQLDDRQIHIPSNWDTFAAPATGQSYVDPTFGCRVKRITNGSAEETLWDGLAPSLMNFYSTLSSMNATDTLLFIYDNGSYWRIRDTNGNIVVPRTSMPSINGHPVWNASTGNVFYYTSYNNTFYQGTVSGNSVISTPLHTFSEYSGVVSPDAGDLSQDGDHIALVGLNSNNTMDIFVWSLSAQTKTSIYTTTCTAPGLGGQPGCLHKLQLTPDNRMTIEFANDGSGVEQGVRLWTGTALVPLQDRTAHYDVGYDLLGNTVFISQNNSLSLPGLNDPCADGWGMDVRQMNNFQSAICLIDYQPFWHVSYRGGPSQPWVALSFFDARTPGPEFFTNDANYQSPNSSNWQLYEDEITIVKVDVSATYRLAHARSRTRESYWAQPHASISRDGKYIVFTSNMAFPNGCPSNMHVPGDCSDVYLINIQ